MRKGDTVTMNFKNAPHERQGHQGTLVSETADEWGRDSWLGCTVRFLDGTTINCSPSDLREYDSSDKSFQFRFSS